MGAANAAKPNPVRDKSFAFALRVVKLARGLQDEKREFVLSRQVLRSGTAIGALVREAEHAQSRADFISKMSIALKEANETDYWVDLLHQSGLITKDGRAESMNQHPLSILNSPFSILHCDE
ncbi:MAG: four helix bundle protein [Vicinamibacterales bacterium]